MDITVPNLVTIRYHCKELLVPRSWNSWFLTFEPFQGTAGCPKLKLMLSNLGTRGYHCKELPVPRGWKTWLPTWQPLVTIVRNCRFLKVGTHGYQPGNQRLPLQGTAGCQNWNSWLPTLEPVVTIASNCWFPKVGTHGSQRWNHGLPMQELLIPKGWNSWFGIALCCLLSR